MRPSTMLFYLTRRLLLHSQFRDPGGDPKLYLFGQLKRIAREWLDGGYLRCTGGTYPAQLVYQDMADRACERIAAAITASLVGERPIKAVLVPYNPTGSTAHVNFTSKKTRWQTDHWLCHVNYVVCDSDWEAEFCRAAEANPRVRAYVKNQGLSFEVPYLLGATPKKYLPDFVVRVDDGHGDDDLLNLVVEIKGYRGEDAKDKANTMDAYWVPGVNNLGTFGRWAFAEFKESVYAIAANFDPLIERAAAGNAD
jgi:type III restriction enzyme